MKFVRYKTPSGAVAAIIGNAGRKYTPTVWLDYPVRLRKVPNAEVARYTEELTTTTVNTAARQMLYAGKRMGITGGAKKFLSQAQEITA